MKKMILLVLYLVAANCFGQGFRGFPWGTLPEEVMTIEGIRSIFDAGNGIAEISYLYIPGSTKKVNGYDAIVTFRFGKNGLIMGEYFIQYNEAAFYSLSVLLENKYGLPKTKSKTKEGLDVKVWITKDGSTRIELAIVAAPKLPPLIKNESATIKKSVQLRYFDARGTGRKYEQDLEEQRPEL